MAMRFDPSPHAPDTIVTVVDIRQVHDAVLSLRCATIRAIAAVNDVLDRMAPPSPVEVRDAPR
jgi:hypothetical protein